MNQKEMRGLYSASYFDSGEGIEASDVIETQRIGAERVFHIFVEIV